MESSCIEYVLHVEDVYPASGVGPVIYDAWLVDADEYPTFRFAGGWPSTAFLPSEHANARETWARGEILLTDDFNRWVPCERLTPELLLEAGRRWARELGHRDAHLRLGDRDVWAAAAGGVDREELLRRLLDDPDNWDALYQIERGEIHDERGWRSMTPEELREIAIKDARIRVKALSAAPGQSASELVRVAEDALLRETNEAFDRLNADPEASASYDAELGECAPPEDRDRRPPATRGDDQ